MYESVIPSVCCLVWIAHISSSFMPTILTVRRYDKAVLPFGFFPLYSKTVQQNCVSQKHEEDRRNPFSLYRKELMDWKVGKNKECFCPDNFVSNLILECVLSCNMDRTFPEGKTSIERTRTAHCWNTQWIFNKFWTLRLSVVRSTAAIR